MATSSKAERRPERFLCLRCIEPTYAKSFRFPRQTLALANSSPIADYRIGVSGLLALLQQFQRVLPSIRLGGYSSSSASNLHQDVTVGGVVVHHQKRRQVSEPGKFRPTRDVGAASQTETSGKVEGAALAGSAFHPDPPSHQLHQVRGDRQAQSGTPVPAGR